MDKNERIRACIETVNYVRGALDFAVATIDGAQGKALGDFADSLSGVEEDLHAALSEAANEN